MKVGQQIKNVKGIHCKTSRSYDCFTVSQRRAAPGTRKVINDKSDTIKGNDIIQVKSRLHVGGLLLTTLIMLRTKKMPRILVETPPYIANPKPKSPNATIPKINELFQLLQLTSLNMMPKIGNRKSIPSM